MFTGLLYPAKSDLSRLENGMIVGSASYDPQQSPESRENDLLYRLEECKRKKYVLEEQLEAVSFEMEEIRMELLEKGFMV